MTGPFARCGWCGGLRGLALVGIVEAASGAGGSVYACADCRNRLRILTVDEHPADSLGGVRYRPRATR